MRIKEIDRVYWIIGLAILVALPLLFMRPLSMFSDGIARHVINVEQIVNGDFSFHTWPVYIFLLLIPKFIFGSGALLTFGYKAVSFIFFVGSLFVAKEILERLKLKKREQNICLVLFSFSAWALLLSAAVLQDMVLTFFSLSLFLALHDYLYKKRRWWLVSIMAALLLLTKQTALIIVLGFIIYSFLNKNNIKRTIKAVLAMGLGFIPLIPWVIKNQLERGYGFGGSAPGGSLFNLIPTISFDALYREFHYFWEIVLPEKTGLVGFTSFLFDSYHLGALIVSSLVTVLIIYGLIRYFKKDLALISGIAPLYLFSLIYYPFFSPILDYYDAGRYSFPLLLFLMIFPAKIIANLKKENLRKAGYFLVILFCIFSIASAYGITYYAKGIDDQIKEVGEFIGPLGPEEFTTHYGYNFTVKNGKWTLLDRPINSEFVFISDNELVYEGLIYYVYKSVRLNEKNLNCSGEVAFETEKITVFKEEKEFRICRVR